MKRKNYVLILNLIVLIKIIPDVGLSFYLIFVYVYKLVEGIASHLI